MVQLIRSASSVEVEQFVSAPDQVKPPGKVQVVRPKLVPDEREMGVHPHHRILICIRIFIHVSPNCRAPWSFHRSNTSITTSGFATGT